MMQQRVALPILLLTLLAATPLKSLEVQAGAIALQLSTLHPSQLQLHLPADFLCPVAPVDEPCIPICGSADLSPPSTTPGSRPSEQSAAPLPDILLNLLQSFAIAPFSAVATSALLNRFEVVGGTTLNSVCGDWVVTASLSPVSQPITDLWILGDSSGSTQRGPLAGTLRAQLQLFFQNVTTGQWLSRTQGFEMVLGGQWERLDPFQGSLTTTSITLRFGSFEKDSCSILSVAPRANTANPG